MNDIVGDAGDSRGDALPLDVAGGDGLLGFGFGLLMRDSRVSGLRFLWRVLAGFPQRAGERDDRAEKAEDSKESGASEDGFAVFPEGVRDLLERGVVGDGLGEAEGARDGRWCAIASRRSSAYSRGISLGSASMTRLPWRLMREARELDTPVERSRRVTIASTSSSMLEKVGVQTESRSRRTVLDWKRVRGV